MDNHHSFRCKIEGITECGTLLFIEGQRFLKILMKEDYFELNLERNDHYEVVRESRGIYLVTVEGQNIYTIELLDDSSVDAEFEKILSSYTTLTIKRSEVARRMEETADYASDYILKGSKALASSIGWGAEKAKKKLKKNEEEFVVPERTNRKIKTMATGTKAVAGATGVLAKGAVAVTGALATTIASQIGGDESNSSKNKNTKEIVHAGLKSYAKLTDAVVKGGSIIASAGGDATVSLVEHKYGAQAAESAKNSVGAVGNFGKAVMNARELGVKSVAKGVAKATASEITSRK